MMKHQSVTKRASTTQGSCDDNDASVRHNAWVLTGLAVVFAAIFLLAPDTAHAASKGGGSEFQDIWDKLVIWSGGYLGKIIALTMILIGIFYGLARQSIMSFALGIGTAMGLVYAPGVVDNIFSATLDAVNGMAPLAVSLANGLGP